MDINGFLMSKDTVIVEIKDNDLNIKNETLLPLFLKNFPNIAGWLKSRAIDTHRTNSRLLKKALRLTEAEEAELVLSVNAATITDTYWLKKTDDNLTYEDIRFKNNMFDKLALYGDPDSFNNEYSRTPELTNIGSYEKCWRIIDEKWWLYKQGNELEQFSELFICEFGKALEFSMAHYEKDGKYVRSLDFTDGASVNFELAESLTGSDEDYTRNFAEIKKLSPKAAKQYIEMIYLDTLCFNMDRHTKNYGLIRDVKNGEILGLAPNFDNNIALISRGYPKNIERQNDKLISLFIEFLENNEDARDCFLKLKHPEITEKLIIDCCDKVPVKADKDFICRFILNAQHQIMAELKQEQKMKIRIE